MQCLLNLGSGEVNNPMAASLRERLQEHLSPRVIRFLVGARLRDTRPTAPIAPLLPADAGQELRALDKAWRIAAASTASSPGEIIAYYSLEHQGVQFPGERPWAPRWQSLCNITNYAGKRVLELGCNMGLLSVFLLKKAAVSAALAVDCDRSILQAAGHVADAFGVRPEFMRIDFDQDADWEVVLTDFRPDIVFALSVLHWIRDKERFLAFLGRFDEIVYEGHDSTRTERQRLRRVGFSAIDLVATSERSRPILHCRKALPH